MLIPLPRCEPRRLRTAPLMGRAGMSPRDCVVRGGLHCSWGRVCARRGFCVQGPLCLLTAQTATNIISLGSTCLGLIDIWAELGLSSGVSVLFSPLSLSLRAGQRASTRLVQVVPVALCLCRGWLGHSRGQNLRPMPGLAISSLPLLLLF